MSVNEYIYQDRAVAFVDVLGFRDKLNEFEQDAKTRITEGAEYLVSQKVNEFGSGTPSVSKRLIKPKK